MFTSFVSYKLLAMLSILFLVITVKLLIIVDYIYYFNTNSL